MLCIFKENIAHVIRNNLLGLHHSVEETLRWWLNLLLLFLYRHIKMLCCVLNSTSRAIVPSASFKWMHSISTSSIHFLAVVFTFADVLSLWRAICELVTSASTTNVMWNKCYFSQTLAAHKVGQTNVWTQFNLNAATFLFSGFKIPRANNSLPQPLSLKTNEVRTLLW